MSPLKALAAVFSDAVSRVSRSFGTSPNREQLTAEFQRWMRENNIPLEAGDAEDMLRDREHLPLTAEQRSYLENFCKRWDAAR